MYQGEWTVGDFDPELAEAIAQEERRQEENIELIASENYTSPRVMEAQGSVLTNKYAEGYPGRRYYGGCEHVDTAEELAIDRACKLFGADYANVQPHSGSQANAAVYMALLEPGDTVLGMSLAEGGHLTHGSPVNFSGRLYNIVPYGLDDDGLIDYDNVARTGRGAPAENDSRGDFRRTLASSTGSAFGISPIRSAHTFSSIWRTWPGSWRLVSIQTRCRLPMSRRRRRTRRCGGRAAD